MRNFLKFSYFFVFFLGFSCGDTTNKKTEDGSSQKVEAKVETETTTKTILFFGDSLTAGYGLDTEEAFPALIQDKLDSLNLDYTVVNAGLSGETTSGGKNRLGWVLNQKVDIFVLELGANDGLRGVPLKETRNNLQTMIDAVRAKNPETVIILAGMQIPPNMGTAYTSEFKNLFPDLAEKNDIELIPFLLKDVGGIPELNQADGIHPTIAGQKIVAANVWSVLAEVVL